MAGFFVTKNGRPFILGKSMDDNIWGSIINLIIILLSPALGIFWRAVQGSWQSLPSHESLHFKIKHSNLCCKICIYRTIASHHHSHRSLLLHIYPWEKKCYKKLLSVSCFTCNKSQRSTTEKCEGRSELHCMQRNLFTCIWLFIWQLQAKWTKTFSFVPNGNWIIFSPVLCYLVRDLLLCHLYISI